MFKRILKPSIQRTLFWSYFAIITFAAIMVGVLASAQVSKDSLTELNRSLHIQANLAAELAKPTLITNNDQQNRLLQTNLVELGNKTDSRFTVIKLSGDVLADSNQDPAIMNNHGQRPEVLTAKLSGVGTSSRFSHTVQQQMSYLAVRVENNGEPLGFVRVSLPLSAIDKQLQQLQFSITLSAAVTTLVAIIVGFLLVRHFFTPLVKMTEVAKAISQGDYSQRLTNKQNDEIGQLAKAFNVMAKSAERRLNKIVADRNRLAMIFSGMVEGVIDVDSNGRIRHINQKAADMLTISSTASLNRLFVDLVDIEQINDAISNAKHTQKVVNNVMKRQLADGGIEQWNIYVAPVKDEAGKALGLVVVLNDVSEVAHLEQVRRDFVGNASHELKTPIAVIQGVTETIIEDDDMPVDIRQRFMEKINVQSKRLSTLVSDLLTLSRLDDMQKDIGAAPVSLNVLTEQALIDAAPHCKDKQINVSCDLPVEPLTVIGDQHGLTQMLDNLLSNAVKYTPENGNIHVSLKEVNHQAQLIVKDTGIGISAAHQPRIFERFYRVDDARTRELGGTGLGLSIVKNIVERHHGTIELVSRENHGSTFCVTLPLK